VYNSQFAPGVAPVQAMVNDLAVQTLAFARGAELRNPTSVYSDLLSVIYLRSEQTAVEGYSGSGAPMRAMLEQGTGAIIAFLAGAAQTIIDPGPNPNRLCPTGSVFCFQAGACLPDCQSTAATAQDAGLSTVNPDDAGASQTDAGTVSCGAAPSCPSGSCTGGLVCNSGCCKPLQ
jgi:hypothetical protein